MTQLYSNSSLIRLPPDGTTEGLDRFSVSGINPDAETDEDVWVPGDMWAAPTTARIHDIVSTSVLDTSDGTGCRTVLVEGLDDDFKEISETVVLNGTTPVPTVKLYLRQNMIIGKSFGSTGFNAGAITSTAQTDDTVTTQIRVKAGCAQTAIYTVPAGKTAHIIGHGSSINRLTGQPALGECILVTYSRAAASPDPGWITEWTTGLIYLEGTIDKQYFDPAIPIPEKTDIRMSIEELTGANLFIHGFFFGLLVDNPV